ncbi:hypothetical protein Tco_1089376 [Tanacetum coccineum]
MTPHQKPSSCARLQADRVNIQTRNVGYNSRTTESLNVQKDTGNPRVWDSKYFMEQRLLAKKDEAGVILTNEQNDFLLADTIQMEELE